MKQLVGQFGRAVVRTDPAQIATLGAGGTVGEFAGQLCKARLGHILAQQAEQGLFGMHGEGMYVHPRSDGKQDVAHMQRLPHDELRLVRVVIATAFFFSRLAEW